MNFKKSSEAVAAYEKIYQIEIDCISPNPSQPRTDFDSAAITRLADSIRMYGIIQPLTVRCMSPEGMRYELVAGERRFRAAKLLGYKTVPCIIMSVDDKKSAEMAIIENLLREELNIFEQAGAFKQLIDEHSMTQHGVAAKLSMSQSAVANKLRLLKLTSEERRLILENRLTERHGRALLKIEDPEKRLDVLRHIISTCMNVSSAETYIENILENEVEREEKLYVPKRSSSVADLEKTIEKAVGALRAGGTAVEITRVENGESIFFNINIQKTPS